MSLIQLVLIAACASTDEYYPGLDEKSLYYKVRPGDTLYGISQRFGRDFHTIAQWNGISDPSRLIEGQTIRLFPTPAAPSGVSTPEEGAIDENGATWPRTAIQSSAGPETRIANAKDSEEKSARSVVPLKESNPVPESVAKTVEKSKSVENESGSIRNKKAIVAKDSKGAERVGQPSGSQETKKDFQRKTFSQKQKEDEGGQKKPDTAAKKSKSAEESAPNKHASSKNTDSSLKKSPRSEKESTSTPPKTANRDRKIEKDEKNSQEKALKLSWRWPLKGVIAKNYSQTSGKGLEIAGKFGEAVRAAAGGEVVYCGQGLIGYGNLIIVKHDAHFLSAYGNNSRLLVREGDIVNAGQQIAEVGTGTNKKAALHFEIRRDGKPVNPIRHLPKP